MDRVLSVPLKLGDIDDAEAYVRRFVLGLGIEGEDARDAIMVGITYLVLAERDLPAGNSLKATAGGIVLRHRLIDWKKARDRQCRLEETVGLPWETEAGAEPVATYHPDPAIVAERREQRAESQRALRAFTRPEDLRKRSAIGRLVGLPSAMPPGTAAGRELFDDIVDERMFRL